MIIPVHTEKDEYDIILARGALSDAAGLLGLHGKVFIVTDTGVPARYAEALAARCRDAHIECIPRGEASKSMAMLERLLRSMLQHGLGRSDSVAAVGGGMVGDLAGFAAACYMRGVDYYNIPTSLLAQLDSSVGGKTAIDLAGVKNIVGAFYQPKRVLIDPDILHTLPPRLLHEGIAEAVKMALTCDAELFELLEVSPLSDELLDTVIERSLRIKAAVVEQDPYETGLRRVLNFGHTVGHAIESLHGGELLHGECVALGMLPMCSPEAGARLKRLLERFALPTRIADTAADLMPYLQHDKKGTDAGITAVLAEEAGSFSLRNMTAEEICRRWEAVQ